MADDGIVVYKRGEIAVPGMDDNIASLLQAIALDDLKVELHRLNEHFKKQKFEGRLEPITISVTDQMRWESFLVDWPFKPLIKASFHNYGPKTAYIRVNDDDWVMLKINDDFNPDYSGADRRIERLYYKCDPGETAQVQRIGKY